MIELISAPPLRLPSNVAQGNTVADLASEIAAIGVNAAVQRREPSTCAALASQLGPQDISIDFAGGSGSDLAATVHRAVAELRGVGEREIDAFARDLIVTYEEARAAFRCERLILETRTVRYSEDGPSAGWHVDPSAMNLVWCPSSTCEDSTRIAENRSVRRRELYEVLTTRALFGNFLLDAEGEKFLERDTPVLSLKMNWRALILGEIQSLDDDSVTPFNVGEGCVHAPAKLRPHDVRIVNTLFTFEVPSFLRHKLRR